MARSTSQFLTLIRSAGDLHRNAKSSIPCSSLLTLRAQSTRSSSSSGELHEIDTSDPLIRKLEDAIHRIIVRRSAPDWLPFLPGTSYWVPPSRSSTNGLAQLIDKLANPLTEEESMAVTTVRGWPSSAYFIQGSMPEEMEKLFVAKKDSLPSSIESKSEDEE